MSRRPWRTCSLAFAALICVCVAAGQEKSKEAATKSEAKANESQVEHERKPAKPGKDSGDVRQTPFGSTRVTEDAARQKEPAVSSVSHLITLREQGDTIVFTQKTPFGPRRWERKESQLSDQERELLKMHRAKKRVDGSSADEKLSSGRRSEGSAKSER
jgi:hypothetical protein